MNRLVAVTALAFAVIANAGAAAPSVVTTNTTTQTFTAVADTWIDADHPTSNYGRSTSLRVAASPLRRTLLRFDVGNLSGSVVRATLRLYASNESPPGYVVNHVTGSWDEYTVTWKTAPSLGASIASSGAYKAGWTSVDVTQAVTAGGVVEFELTTTDPKTRAFASRETGANAPRLVVETSPTPVDVQPSFPIRAAFYYPWYPAKWTLNGQYPHYTPSLGYYDSSSTAVIDQHIHALEYGKIGAGIASWWGVGSTTDGRIPLLLSETRNLGSSVRWALDYEPEGANDPTVAQLTSELTYIRAQYGGDPAYLRVSGRFVVFVTTGAFDGCATADRWKDANTVGAYVVLEMFSGYTTCASQPDAWYQYAPMLPAAGASGYSYSISPGYWRADESTPRLARDPTRWAQNIRDMIASNTPWQLVTTFNQWTSATAVESANEWASSSGYGAYLDALHADGAPADTTPPTAPTNLATSNVSATGLTLSWTASTDDVAVAGYRVYVGSNRVATTTATSYAISGLSCGTTYLLGVEAYDAAGNVSQRATRSAATAACPDPVIAAAGDISCDPADSSFNGGLGTSSACHQRYTSDLLVAMSPAAVLALGDNQYNDNAYSKYVASGAYDATWGRVKGLIHPAIGNHEYLTAGAGGYFQYFGSAAGDPSKAYYSFDIGKWHLIELNSNCSQVGGCGAGSPQEQWLQADLAAHPAACTLAYWHHPRWSSGPHGSNSAYDAFWKDLYAAHADLVLNGHDHDYERFAPQTPSAALDTANGIREFVVGTGGKSHYGFSTVVANSQVRNSTTYGVLKLTLHPNGYDWQFVHDSAGTFTDSGSGTCH